MKTCLIALLSFMLLTATVFGQGTSASLTGTVQDASGAVINGAIVIARNVDTGVETRATSNDRGRYTIPSLQNGSYEVSADASGFSTARSNVRLNVGTQGSLDFTLSVAGTVTEVQVTGAAESVILEAGASTGTVMQEETLATIPMLSNNIMELINIMGGVTPPTDPVFGANSQTFAGVTAQSVNITRDGMSVNEVRFTTGINASTNINPEMISEFRMVLSPVDAEMGRGAGQVQMTTRSGSNAFHGAAVWNVQNTALDAVDFSRKLSNNPPNWRNMNNYLLTFSGPVIRNRTFFFVTWEQQFNRSKSTTTAKVLTPCARVGIYRYIGGSVPQAAAENNTYNPDNDNRRSVDLRGNILDRASGAQFYNSTTREWASFDQAHPSSLRPHTDGTPNGTMRAGDGDLLYESVFGVLTPAARAALNGSGGVHDDCSAFASNSSLWNPNAGVFGVEDRGWTFWDDRPWGTGYDDRDGRAYRYAWDPTGYVDRFTYGVDYSAGRVEMPPVNNWQTGDGLNVAGHRWVIPLVGEGGSIWGTGGDPNRKSITVKIDHNINNEHRLSGTYTQESFYVDDGYAQWPEKYGGYGGGITRKPYTFLTSLTSTLRPTLLNELRFGISRTDTFTNSPMEMHPEMPEILALLLPPEKTQGFTTLSAVGEVLTRFSTDPIAGGEAASHPYGSRGNIAATWGGADPRWTFGDTVTWMKGAHSFKGGIEYRRQSSTQEFSGNRAFAASGTGGIGGAYTRTPIVVGGALGAVSNRRQGMITYNPVTQAGEAWLNVPVSGDSYDRHSTQVPAGTLSGVAGMFSTPYQMMTYFSGAIQRVTQLFYFVPDVAGQYGSRWNDTSLGEDWYKYTLRNQEFSFFFKDDWKVNNSLTLNLGVRWEYYGVPYVDDGKTLGLKGGGNSAFGVSKVVEANRFMIDRGLASSAYENIPFVGYANPLPIDPISQYIYVGPGSQNPDQKAWNRDVNNIAPHLGFAWQLPWFGRGQTTLRGGWSVSYSQIETFDNMGVWIADVNSAVSTRPEHHQGLGINTISGTTAHYMDLTDLAKTGQAIDGNDYPLPMKVRGDVVPLRPWPVGYFQTGATVMADDLHNPKTHSLNMSLTRNIGRALTVDVRYIGTLARELSESLNLNTNNYLSNQYVGDDMIDELNKIRRDGDYQSALFNSLIPKRLNSIGGLSTNNAIQGLSGSDQIRHTNGQASNLAQLNYSGIIGTLTGNGGYPTVTGESGRLFRDGCLPSQRTNPNAAASGAGGMDDHVNNPCLYQTPLNFLVANPQFSSVGLRTNGYLSNYHSMQTQVTLRPTHGLNFQATWTWSRALSNSSWNNYLGDREYLLTGQHRSHTLNTFGNYELPFGSRGVLFREASGFFKKAVEGWSLSWVTSMSSGTAMSITGDSTQWGNSWPELVRPDLWDNKSGKITTMWNDDGTYAGGRYWGDKYTKVLDPGSCNPANMTTVLYDQFCVNPDTGALRDSARMAIALADGTRDIDPLTGVWRAAVYTDAAEAAKYGASVGDPIIVFRQSRGYGSVYDPYHTGNFKSNQLTGQGRFSFDMAAAKSVEFMEGKRIEIRVDAQNILNHATPSGGAPGASDGGRFMSISNPANLGLTSTAIFGNVANKGGHRTFQARLRLSF